MENKGLNERINNEITKEDVDRESERAKLYFNIPNVKNPDIPREMAVKALPINPNTPERIAKVLDDILSSANMENKFSVKIVFDGKNVSKELNRNKDFRKFVVVTSDGLPYKAMIELIKNVHTCAVCGKRLRYLSNMTDHFQNTHHKEYYQT